MAILSRLVDRILDRIATRLAAKVQQQLDITLERAMEAAEARMLSAVQQLEDRLANAAARAITGSGIRLGMGNAAEAQGIAVQQMLGPEGIADPTGVLSQLRDCVSASGAALPTPAWAKELLDE